MIVSHTPRNGAPIIRHRFELEPRYAEALADLYRSLFDDGKEDDVAVALGIIAREYKLDQAGELPLSVLDGGHVAAPTPIPSSEGRPE